MRSKTSCFNTALLKKNLTRFAPVWGLYILCLVLGTLLLYSNGGTAKQFHFAANMADMFIVMAVVNLFYAPLVAQLLFGDLYNSRMCYALHAMPVRRESLYVTNLISGLFFSLVPTAVMAAVCIPLMAGSCFVNAWQIPLYVFAASNLQFVCFFGIAVVSALCAGNRLGMLMIYGIVNFIASILYWLIDTLYTPMLYGVVTPTALQQMLTPIIYITDRAYLTTPSFSDIVEQYDRNWEAAVAEFTVTDQWPVLLIYAGIGIAFLVIGIFLYRKRHLECAGDALAFKILEPLFQVLVAMVTACAAQWFVSVFMGYSEDVIHTYLFLAAGLVVGWFGCRMLIERSTRVFRLKTFLGLAGLAAAVAVSLFATSLDIFGIETWQPKLQDVESVYFRSSQTSGQDLTEEADIARILSMQEEALTERLEHSGPYVEGIDGSWVYNIDSNSHLIGKKQDEITDCRMAFDAYITYTLHSGKVVVRRYVLWSDGESGDTARECLSDWDKVVNKRYWDKENVVENILADLRTIEVDGFERTEEPDRQFAEGLIEAIKLDCAQHNMAQDVYLHTGHFISKEVNDRGEHYKRSSISIYLNSNSRGWYIEIFPDSENTIKYLQSHDLLAYDISHNNLHYN